jgi:hypothetical protein
MEPTDANPKTLDVFKPLSGVEKYQKNIQIIEEYHTRLWEEQQHELYTDHGKKHSSNIIAKIDQWLGNNRLIWSETSSREASAFILLSAVYLHDIGMQCGRELYRLFYPDGTTAPDDMTEVEFLEKVREKHNLLSREIVLGSIEYGTRDMPGFPKLNTTQDVQKEMEAVSLLCASHCDPIPTELSGEITEHYPLEGKQWINLRMLMYILRVADALDADRHRINKDLFDQEDRWKEVIKYPKYLMHIFRHYVVERITVPNFEFQYLLPNDHPKAYDEHFKHDCQVFVEAPLKRNYKFYSNAMRELGINFPEPYHTSWRKGTKAKFPELPNEAIDWLHREAKRLRTDQIEDCLDMAEEKLFIAGQNLFFLAHPERYTNRRLEQQHFHDSFFARLRDKEKGLKIRILILNPKANTLVEEWHNRTIRNWQSTPQPERSKEHRENKPNFKSDLWQSFHTFKQWQQEIQNSFPSLNWSSSSIKSYPEDYPFLVKCASERIDSANIIDPDKTNPKRNESLVNTTHRWHQAIEDAQGRGTRVLDKFDNAAQFEQLWGRYNKLFEQATYILDV